MRLVCREGAPIMYEQGFSGSGVDMKRTFGLQDLASPWITPSVDELYVIYYCYINTGIPIYSDAGRF
ncbi:hypothetical protein Mpal_0077 [Methanosphaerula palustris E1-9c]|uniref:Uncharacterized protein n=1 Tax=Methanosphaerula palustris (strain ATCC BAA-1556 / DSM 19958 / E1-9c) TaxID=521011 RepID=B8GIC0_METPE|nr:hypothetical protein Mpal_0077 [Methanosphaerula palustris E1-9c]